jgi:hypothetical protein
MGTIMPVNIPVIPFIRRRKRRAAQLGPPPVQELILVAAEYHPEGVDVPWVRLAFDRAINIAAINPTQIMVNDPVTSGTLLMGGGSAQLIAPATVQVELGDYDPASGTQLLLSVSTTNGIVAADDASAWEGVTNLELPFP